jgi:hypothetical protein
VLWSETRYLQLPCTWHIFSSPYCWLWVFIWRCHCSRLELKPWPNLLIIQKVYRRPGTSEWPYFSPCRQRILCFLCDSCSLSWITVLWIPDRWIIKRKWYGALFIRTFLCALVVQLLIICGYSLIIKTNKSTNMYCIRRAQVKVGLINLCKGLFSLNARIYYKLKSGT